MAMMETALDCLEQWSKADFVKLEQICFEHAKAWVVWAHRTGFDKLQGFTPNQLERIADEIVEFSKCDAFRQFRFQTVAKKG